MTVVTDPHPELTFGPLNLLTTDAEAAAQGYRFTAMGTDNEWGNPIPIKEKILSWLQDGALVALRGYDNREIFVRVRIEADDSDLLAAGEEALFLNCGGPNTLIWTPPDGAGAACVFEVVTSMPELITNDAAELFTKRFYGLKITALPFARAEELTVVSVPAPSVTAQTFATVDNCNSATGWSTIITGPPTYVPQTAAPTVVGGARLNKTASGIPLSGGFTTFEFEKTGMSIALNVRRYFRVDLSIALNGVTLDSGQPVVFFINDQVIFPTQQSGNVYWFDAAEDIGTGGTVNKFRLRVNCYGIQGNQREITLSLGDIQQSNILGDQGTNRQLNRTIPVAGSARTQGSLALVDAANALGTTLVHTMPSVPGLEQPNLRRLLAVGPAATPDSTTVSGARSDLATLHAFDIPVTGLLPGGHLLLARIKHATAGNQTLTWAAKGRQGTTSLADPQSGSTVVNLPVNDSYEIVTVASLNLPTRKLGTGGRIRIELQSGAGVVLDEVWVVNIQTGRLTIVRCGTAAPSAGGAANRLWIDSATVESPVPAVYLGTLADRSDAYHAGAEMDSFMPHEYEPGVMNVFTVTTNSIATAIILSHYARFHTHVKKAA